MKHEWRSLAFRTLLLPFALAVGCSDGSGPDDSLFAGRWAGAAWVGNAEALVAPGATIDTLYLFGVRASDSHVPEEVITIRLPFTGAGSYSLSRDAVEFAVLIGGDVVEAEYIGRGPNAGTLVVDTYKTTAGSISGTLTFDAAAVRGSQRYGATASFTNGQFRASVRQRQ